MLNPQKYTRNVVPSEAVQVPHMSPGPERLSVLAEIAVWCGGRLVHLNDSRSTQSAEWAIEVRNEDGDLIRPEPGDFIVKGPFDNSTIASTIRAATEKWFWDHYQPVDAAPPDHPYPQPAADPAPPSISDAIEAIMEDPAINALFHSKITGDSLRSILCGYALNLRANERKRAEAALDAAARQGPGPIITTSREACCIRAATDEEKALYHKTMSEIARAKADAIAPILSGEALRQQACTKPMIETRRKLPVFGE